MYYSVDFTVNSSMFLQSFLEKIAGSIPDSDHPPTPSATAIILSETAAASSPPLAFFYMWGLMQSPELKTLIFVGLTV
jgi:hypothetical protein